MCAWFVRGVDAWTGFLWVTLLNNSELLFWNMHFVPASVPLKYVLFSCISTVEGCIFLFAINIQCGLAG